MPQYLPGEITDVIIAHVWPHTPSLCSCALVQRQWLLASRYYLFLTIQIDHPLTYAKLLENVLRSEEMQIWLAHTRELRVLNTEDADEVTAFPTPFGKRFLYEFAGQLPRLQSLELFHIDFVNGGFPPAAYMAFSRFSSIKALALTNCFFPSFTTFRRMLEGLRSLRELALSNVHWHPVLAHHSFLLVAAPRGPRLESLFIAEVAKTCARVLFGWLNCTTSSQTIRRLSFEASLASTTLKYFHNTSLSPTEVHIWLYEDAACLKDVLPHFTQMTSLRITAPDMSEQSLWTQLTEILKVVSSSAIRSIAVDCFVNSVLEAELEAGDIMGLLGVPTRGLELLEQIVEQSVFQHLTALDVHLQQWIALPLDARTIQDVVLEVVRSRLPKVFGRGIAAFDFQFTRAVFCGLPLTEKDHNEGTSVQGWVEIGT